MLLSNVQLYVHAQAAIRARDEFLSLAAHELRTPLTALTLSADVLERETPRDVPSAIRHAVSVVGRQAKRLAHLTDILLLGSEPERAEPPKVIETIDATALVREVVADFEPLAARTRSAIHLRADGPVLIRGDRAELRLLVSNLLDNALKFGGGRPIDVAVAAHDGTAEVTVRDQGIGIPEEQRWRLFRRFERGVSAKHFGGLGLGLHVAARIARAHGGSIRAESEPERGASLIVELPRDGAGRASEITEADENPT
ncbi:MAG: HAMP domain-containing histidine kinase [Sandaracinaceae bacterium]|nr:HAMP domain-containing histidine kinase [Sandaracinaceae bacterium]